MVPCPVAGGSYGDARTGQLLTFHHRHIPSTNALKREMDSSALDPLAGDEEMVNVALQMAIHD